MEQKPISPYRLIESLEKKGHAVFKGGKDYNLNIIGIRTNDMESNTFNDRIVVFWKHPFSGVWELVNFHATTDPGLYYRLHPLNKMGTAVLKPGQYRGAYKIGLHHHKPALVQHKPITVYRDNNKNNIIDTSGPDVIEDTGMFGINIHRANDNGMSVNVNKWSAGCQVVQNQLRYFMVHGSELKFYEFDYFMFLIFEAQKNYGSIFTYTLIEEKDLL